MVLGGGKGGLVEEEGNDISDHFVLKILDLILVQFMHLNLSGIVRLAFAEIWVVPYSNSPFSIKSYHLLINFQIAQFLEQFQVSTQHTNNHKELLGRIVFVKIKLAEPQWNPFCINSSRFATAADIDGGLEVDKTGIDDKLLCDAGTVGRKIGLVMLIGLKED